MPNNEPGELRTVDVTVPSSARVYDYLLGGKNHFAVDRAVGDRIRSAVPGVQIGVVEQRAVLRRATHHLVAEAGLRQIIDVGTGLPTVDNVHEVAHRIDPGVRVTYVDNDPIVLTHARALLANDTVTVVAQADLRRPDELLERVAELDNIDFGEPIGLILCGILHYLSDEEDPFGVTARLVAALPPGSQVFIQHLVESPCPMGEELKGMGRAHYRSKAEIARFFTGLELVDPGLVHVASWRPDYETPPLDYDAALLLALAGLGRKP